MDTIGSNEFKNVKVPLAFLNRYFISKGDKNFDVVLNFKGKAIYEIKNNEPSENVITNISKTNAGIITVSDKNNKFLYKIRPGSETSIVFGTISQNGITIKISDKSISINSSTFERNTISGFGVGIIVNQNGSIGIGAPLPEFLKNII